MTPPPSHTTMVRDAPLDWLASALRFSQASSDMTPLSKPSMR